MTKVEKNKKVLDDKITMIKSTRPRRKLSFFRLLIAFTLLILISYFSFARVNTWVENDDVAEYEPWYASYVDVTATPVYSFEQLGTSRAKSVVLSFIVSSKQDPCIPTWGTYFTLEEVANSLDLDRRIARLQQQEGRIAVSFGGAINDELALNCKDTESLKNAYKMVLDRYNVDTIDLDLENTGLTDSEAAARRAVAISRLQNERREEGKGLAVWLTLPVIPQGLTPAGTDAVRYMLEGGVDLSGVNVMTMNYGESKEGFGSMYEASRSALIETHRQLGILYKQSGVSLNSKSLWRKIGATPMIGQNDFHDEVFTLDDAVLLNQFAILQGIGRMSMWSANRDIPCGENYVDTKVVSDACSGVRGERMSFTNILSEGFDGDLTQNSTLLTISDFETTEQVVDDPATSPYQIWQESGAYLKGVKVVWRGNVYEAKWWTRGDLPDNPVLQSWETPWKLVGPVLPGETPVSQPTLPVGTFPVWSGKIEYETGQRVLFEGVPFQAKWWNQGQSPAAAAANADSSPWVALTQAQINEIIKELGLSLE